MKEHWDFLKESDTSFGLFYPLHYTILAFENLDDANAAHDRFVADGFGDGDVAAVSGPFVVDYLESEDGKAWFEKLQGGIAKVVGTETGFLNDDIALARRGGAFVFVYTPKQDQVEQARELIKQVRPIFARRYHRIGIENVLYPTGPSTLKDPGR